EPDRTLLPGMFMNADIELSTNQINALPSDAIVRFENKHYVFVEKGDRHFEKMEVQIGDSENGYTEILNSDTLKNKNFVIKGAYVLMMDLKNDSEDKHVNKCQNEVHSIPTYFKCMVCCSGLA